MKNLLIHNLDIPLDWITETKKHLDKNTYKKHSRIVRDKNGELQPPHNIFRDLSETRAWKLEEIYQNLIKNFEYIEMLGFDMNHLIEFMKEDIEKEYSDKARKIVMEYAKFISECLYHEKYKPIILGVFDIKEATKIYTLNNAKFLEHRHNTLKNKKSVILEA